MNQHVREIEFTDLPGIRIGNAQDLKAATGCTVVLCENGAVAGVDVRGGSPGTRETDSLDPRNARQKINAVLLAGGSAFGLDAAAGVMRFLEEEGVGRDAGVGKIPVVCGAILFDLKCGDPRIRPDKAMGYEACRNAFSGECPQGNIGAGTGATIGKINGPEYAMKGGLGTFALNVGELMVGAAIAVNCVGDIYDGQAGRLIAGVLNPGKKSIGNTEEIILRNYSDRTDFFSGNTVIGVVVTNARLSKSEVNKLASVSHNGIARAVRPAHSIFDGDTLFAMSAGNVEARLDAVSVLAARVVEQAILRAVKSAETLYGYTAYRDLIQR